MEDGARDVIAPCTVCRDPALVQYEELQGGFVCIGCGAVLSQLMVSELPSTQSDIDKGVQIGGTFVGVRAGTVPFLSREARHGGARTCAFSSPNVCHQRRRLHRLCQQLGLPAAATEEALCLTISSQSRRLPAEAACVYTICRRHGRGVTFSEVCAAAAVSRRQAGRCLRRLHAGMECSSSSPDRFVRRALAVLGCSFEEEKRSLALLRCLESLSSSAQHPDLTAYAAVTVVALASGRPVPALGAIADQLAVKVRPLQDRIVQTKKALLALAKVLPLGIVLTLNNVHLYYGLIVDHLPVLADLHRKPARSDDDAIVRDYEAAVARCGLRIEAEPQQVAGGGSSSGSDVESMSDDEAGRYIRTEGEIRDFLRLQERLDSNSNATTADVGYHRTGLVPPGNRVTSCSGQSA